MKISLKKLGLSLTVVVSSTLVACGNSGSNPISKYDGIKLEDKTNVQMQPQTIMPTNLFKVKDSTGANQLTFVNFTEGQSSQVLVRIEKDPNVSAYSIEMIDFSNAERPTLVPTKDASVYAIQWNPPVGTIGDGQLSQQFRLKIQLVATAAKTQNLIGGTSIVELGVMVNRTTAQPKINVTGIDASTKVTEKVPTVFTVDVTDPNNSPKLPEVIITSYLYANTEAYSADVSRAVFYDDKRQVNPEKIGSNTYRFYYILDIDRLPLDRDRVGKEVPVATSVGICFLVRAESGVGTLSNQSQVCAKGIYAAQPPTLTYVDAAGTAIDTSAAAIEVKPGVETVLTLKVATEHPLSVISVSKADSMIASLTGTKSIACSYDVDGKKNQQTCVVKWTPACVSKTATVSLTVKADATLDTKTKSSSIVRTMTVVPDLDACPVKTAVKGGK